MKAIQLFLPIFNTGLINPFASQQIEEQNQLEKNNHDVGLLYGFLTILFQNILTYFYNNFVNSVVLYLQTCLLLLLYLQTVIFLNSSIILFLFSVSSSLLSFISAS